jgi:hypothetical protein
LADVVGLALIMSTQATQSAPAAPATAPFPVLPLQPEDPPRVGDFWLRGRIAANGAGYLYAGQDEDGRGGVVVMMTEGSADDPAARDRFQRAVEELPDGALLARNSTDDDDVALWVAVGPIAPETDPATPESAASSASEDAWRIAQRHGSAVLSAVLMDDIPHIGRFRGPDFLHYWDARRRPGLFRLWPLPWPGALQPASWLAMLLAMVMMFLLMSTALLIAYLLFRNQPEVDPGPPIPNGTRTVTVTPSQGPTGSTATTTGPGQTPTTGTTGTTTVPRPTGTGRFPSTVPTDGPPPTNPSDRF